MKFSASLVGNPNSGKSTLFNQLTGLRQPVGNYPGVTVEKSQGVMTSSNSQISLVDLPGVYSLVPEQQSSEDERITLNYLVNNPTDLIVNVVDATSLERHLYLTIQLRELNRPMIVIVNKWDLAQQQGLNISLGLLQEKLGCPVISMSAKSKPQAHQLTQKFVLANSMASADSITVDYGLQINQWLSEFEQGNRFLKLVAITQQHQRSDHDIELAIASARYSVCNAICQQVIEYPQTTNASRKSEVVDQWLLKPLVAIPVFLLAMYFMFMFAVHIGGAFIDFFDIAVGAVMVDGLATVLTAWHWPEWIVVILTDGFGTGVQTVSTFIPLIFCLYLFLTALEQSGYLARAAVVTDKVMEKIGLPGSAFVPMLMGFGCTVPAVMATRTLSQKRERILAGIMSHYMVCGARLPVFVLFGAAFFADNALNIVFSLYLLGMFIAILVGLLLKKTILSGDTGSFIIELPQYQMPAFSDLIKRTLKRVKSFVFGAGKTIVIVVTILGVVSSLGTDGSFGNAGKENSLLSTASQSVTPVFAPIGIEDDNWQATVGIFTGLFAKEVLVATLNSLYMVEEETTQEFVFVDVMNEAFQTIPENLSAISDAMLDPLGLKAADVATAEEAAAQQDVDLTTLSQMSAKFNGQIGAYSFLLFILLYAPCASALGAYAREYGTRWMMFVALFTTYIAYFVAALFYQVAIGVPSIFTVAILLISAIFVYALLLNKSLLLWLNYEGRYVKPNNPMPY